MSLKSAIQILKDTEDRMNNLAQDVRELAAHRNQLLQDSLTVDQRIAAAVKAENERCAAAAKSLADVNYSQSKTQSNSSQETYYYAKYVAANECLVEILKPQGAQNEHG